MPDFTPVPIESRRIADDETGKPAVFGAILSGQPQEIHRNLFDGDFGRFKSGVWQCTPGIVAMKDWPYHEFCVLLSGRVIITPEGGVPREYKAGDALVLPMGFTGTWEILETVRKYYAVQARQPLLRRVKERVKGLLRRGAKGGQTGDAQAGAAF
ncbi:cupin domain-containing protein [Azospirillum sp. BE72]|uniref:cupin domain-containing protein n=1 Tax=Azospirillum sp. BE72 TaxID=2817776 RepID=UPI002854AF18|nr:cupin domain-containing protein [Azospirillum sp. BE72]MDR6769833.1 putative cupin superfamily protein [Azospirillum sp. BE72]